MDWPGHSDIESIEPGVSQLRTPLAFYKKRLAKSTQGGHKVFQSGQVGI